MKIKVLKARVANTGSVLLPGSGSGSGFQFSMDPDPRQKSGPKVGSEIETQWKIYGEMVKK